MSPKQEGGFTLTDLPDFSVSPKQEVKEEELPERPKEERSEEPRADASHAPVVAPALRPEQQPPKAASSLTSPMLRAHLKRELKTHH